MKEASELERWNARFAGENYLFGTEPNAFLVSQRSRLKRGMKALAVVSPTIQLFNVACFRAAAHVLGGS